MNISRPMVAWTIPALFAITAIHGCAVRHTLYQTWAQQLAEAPKRQNTKEDISLILGAEPNKCDVVSPRPKMGILLSKNSGTTILAIQPDSPVIGSGIEVGDKIISVNSIPVNSVDDIMAVGAKTQGPDNTIAIETNRGSYVIKPRFTTNAEQCYWQINAGEVGRTGGSAYVNQYGGSAVQGGTKYQRFFRATCRFADGVVTRCQSNWQE